MEKDTMEAKDTTVIQLKLYINILRVHCDLSVFFYQQRTRLQDEGGSREFCAR
jgi:hypothetical protein